MTPQSTQIKREAYLVHMIGPNATTTIDVSELKAYHRNTLNDYAEIVSDHIGSYVDPQLLKEEMER